MAGNVCVYVFAFVMLNTSVRSVYCSLSTSVFNVIVSSSCSCFVKVLFSSILQSVLVYFFIRQERKYLLHLRQIVDSVTAKVPAVKSKSVCPSKRSSVTNKHCERE